MPETLSEPANLTEPECRACRELWSCGDPGPCTHGPSGRTVEENKPLEPVLA